MTSEDRGGGNPSPGPDPFALLGLAPGYDLDLDALERAYHERSRALHPDRFASAPAAERVAALTQSRALNDAYQLLRRPTRRAEHLLARAGIAIGDHERLEPAFLMEILELREALAEARIAGRLDDVTRMQADMQARQQALVASLAPAFAAGELAAAKRALITLRYVDRYLEECDAVLDAADAEA
ncbi:MAG: Fe-S protein assembly co-chaperone HscB [Kofleriaceae bacterium]